MTLLGAFGGCGADPDPEGEPLALERGRYLVEVVAGCPVCHTPVDSVFQPVSSKRFAGGFEFTDVFGTWRSPNITQDLETGIGGWTDEEIIAAIREGIRPDGERLYVIMPYLLYNRLSEADARAMVAYLRTIPAVDNAVERVTDLELPKLPAPAPTGLGPAAGDEVEVGEYLASLMVCVDCHTPMAPDGSPDTTRAYAGGFPFRVPPALGTGTVWSSNITPDPETGIGHYSEEQIIATMTRMEKADGSPILGPMTLFQGGWSQLDPADAVAIARFLMSLPPIENRVPESVVEPASPPEDR